MKQISGSSYRRNLLEVIRRESQQTDTFVRIDRNDVINKTDHKRKDLKKNLNDDLIN